MRVILAISIFSLASLPQAWAKNYSCAGENWTANVSQSDQRITIRFDEDACKGDPRQCVVTPHFFLQYPKRSNGFYGEARLKGPKGMQRFTIDINNQACEGKAFKIDLFQNGKNRPGCCAMTDEADLPTPPPSPRDDNTNFGDPAKSYTPPQDSSRDSTSDRSVDPSRDVKVIHDPSRDSTSDRNVDTSGDVKATSDPDRNSSRRAE